jgi:hypothetical protein
VTTTPHAGAGTGAAAGAEAAAAAEAASDAGEAPAVWSTADDLAARHAVSRRTVFRWLSAGQVVSREEAGVTLYRVVGARPAARPARIVATNGLAQRLHEPGADDVRAASPEGLAEAIEELAARLGRVEAQLDEEAAAHEADVRGSARELEQARLLTELAQRHAEHSRADLDEVKARLEETLRALDVERERAYRLALVATLPFWQFGARREMLAEIAAMKALPIRGADAGADADAHALARRSKR